MTTQPKSVRQSVSLPSHTARRVKAIAARRRMSANRVLVELIQAGLDAREAEKHVFLALAGRLTSTTDPKEQKRIKSELARMTFGE